MRPSVCTGRSCSGRWVFTVHKFTLFGHLLRVALQLQFALRFEAAAAAAGGGVYSCALTGFRVDEHLSWFRGLAQAGSAFTFPL